MVHILKLAAIWITVIIIHLYNTALFDVLCSAIVVFKYKLSYIHYKFQHSYIHKIHPISIQAVTPVEFHELVYAVKSIGLVFRGFLSRVFNALCFGEFWLNLVKYLQFVHLTVS